MPVSQVERYKRDNKVYVWTILKSDENRCSWPGKGQCHEIKFIIIDSIKKHVISDLKILRNKKANISEKEANSRKMQKQTYACLN